MDLEKIRNDFPSINGNIYLDSACMALKPRQVIEKINEYYNKYPGCGGRSIHKFGNRVSDEFDNARVTLKKFLGAKYKEEIIFSKNTTESINLVAYGYNLNENDKVVISDKEHNSNLLPWQLLKERKKINLEIVETDENGILDLEDLKDKVRNAKLMSIVYSSNIDGVTNPIEKIVKICKKEGCKIMLDGAQAVPHKKINVRKLGIDFMAFSGHKMLGPTGTGVLYGKKEELEKLNSFIIGGDTVKDTTYDSYILEDLPMRFEGGLQDYAGIIGLGEAAKYLMKSNRENIEKHEIELNTILTDELKDKVEMLGPESAKERGGIFSFNINKMDAHHVAMILDEQGIMIRSGMHCVHSWFNARNINGSARASLYMYNNEEEIKKLIEKLKPLLK
jgi:cysteine desulfurase / selenocysteine lyase